MHQNLASINEIDEALVRDDYPRIKEEALSLKANAISLQDADLASLGLNSEKDDVFDKYAAAQAESADAIASAARDRDAGAVLYGVQRMLDSACVVCHTDFRETDIGRTPPVLFMRTLLSSVQSINRGIAMSDFALIAREAREIGAIAHTLTWSQVIEMMFSVKDPAEKVEFRGYFETLSTQAIQVEHAATQRDFAMIAAATQRMLKNGCVSCHAKFRKEIRERAERRR
jgi:cytochrome c556